MSSAAFHCKRGNCERIGAPIAHATVCGKPFGARELVARQLCKSTCRHPALLPLFDGGREYLLTLCVQGHHASPRGRKSNQIAKRRHLGLTFGTLAAIPRGCAFPDALFLFQQLVLGKSRIVIVVEINAARICLPRGKILTAAVHFQEPLAQRIVLAHAVNLIFHAIRVEHWNNR